MAAIEQGIKDLATRAKDGPIRANSMLRDCGSCMV